MAKVCPDCYPVQVIGECGNSNPHGPHVYLNEFPGKGIFSDHHKYAKRCPGVEANQCRTCGGRGIVR
jgi:hypothetical protein